MPNQDTEKISSHRRISVGWSMRRSIDGIIDGTAATKGGVLSWEIAAQSDPAPIERPLGAASL
jgi:hypothetical protein